MPAHKPVAVKGVSQRKGAAQPWELKTLTCARGVVTRCQQNKATDPSGLWLPPLLCVTRVFPQQALLPEMDAVILGT